MQIVLSSAARPYDGTYQMDFQNQLTTREFGWIKRMAGYLPVALEDAGGDPEFVVALTVVALHRAGRIEIGDAPAVFERLIDLPFGETFTLDTSDEETAGEDDAGPPARNSNGNDSSSGAGSTTSSETSPAIPVSSGMPDWAISQSGQPTSAS